MHLQTCHGIGALCLVRVARLDSSALQCAGIFPLTVVVLVMCCGWEGHGQWWGVLVLADLLIWAIEY